jgi:hypothetical protein
MVASFIKDAGDQTYEYDGGTKVYTVPVTGWFALLSLPEIVLFELPVIVTLLKSLTEFVNPTELLMEPLFIFP